MTGYLGVSATRGTAVHGGDFISCDGRGHGHMVTALLDKESPRTYSALTVSDRPFRPREGRAGGARSLDQSTVLFFA